MNYRMVLTTSKIKSSSRQTKQRVDLLTKDFTVREKSWGKGNILEDLGT